MFDKKTVFVLGAGASCAYGFPSARQLTDLLLGRQAWDKIPPNWLEQKWNGLSPRIGRPGSETMRPFRRHFENSDLPSVDQFVHSQPQYEEIAKWLISLMLYQIEQYVVPQGGWLQDLWAEIHSNADKVQVGTLTFVTFNYDRTVEWYFFRRMVATLGEKDGRNLLGKIPIHHIYGSLGPLEGTGHALPYGDAKCHMQESQIDLMRVGTRAKDDVCDAIQSCDRLIFLGFGFDELNIKALDLGHRKDIPEILACGYGLSESRRVAIQRRLPSIRIGKQTDNIETFLHNTAIFV